MVLHTQLQLMWADATEEGSCSRLDEQLKVADQD